MATHDDHCKLLLVELATLCMLNHLHVVIAYMTLAAHGSCVPAAGKTLQYLPFRGSSLVIEPPRDVAKQQLQDCLERVVTAGCSSLIHPNTSKAAADSHQDYFFDLKLVSGQTFCLCHRCDLLLVLSAASLTQAS